MDDDLTVRAAEATDIAAVGELDARITGLAKADYWQRTFARYGARPDRYFLIAEAGGRVLGFIIGEVRAWEFGSGPSGWIFAIGVDPEHRLKKVGSRLIADICRRMTKDGVKTVRTLLARDGALNMAFFRPQGMRGGPFIPPEMGLVVG